MEPMETLSEADIKKSLKNFIKENFLLGNDSNLKDDDSFMGKGIVDSTGILEVVSFVEDAFNIKIDDEELLPENLDSINQLGNFIKKKLNK
ncbi:MAG: acyl carrier protein [Candidatus Omnitrophota bacterium]|jgi:acyl carrier protein